MKNRLLLLTLMFVSSISYADSKMTQIMLEKIVKTMASQSKGNSGVVIFTYSNRTLYLISDVRHNRMRIITPIIKYNKLTRKQIDAVLLSNYHQSLDARYAVSKNILFSAYIHPLSELTKSQIKSAVKQVVSLANTFGGKYSSGVLKFGGKKKKSKGLLL